MSPATDTLGKRVALRRVELGLSQEALAHKCGCSAKTVTLIERGVHGNVGLDILEALSAALGLTLSELVPPVKRAKGE